MNLLPKRIGGVAIVIIMILVMAINFLQFYPITIESVSLRKLLVILLMVVMVIFMIVYYLLERGSQPVEEILEVIDQLSKSKYYARYHGDKFSKEDELGGMINQLAVKLEQKTELLQLKDSKEREVIDHLLVGIIALNKTGKVVLLNPIGRMLIDEKTEPLNQSYEAIIKSYGLRQMIDQAYESEQASHQEIDVYYPEERILDVHVVPILTKRQQLEQVMVLMYDITTIRRLEKVKTTFVANASHELRTPVTAVKGFSETLLDGAKDDPELCEKFLKIIHKESLRLERLINDILQLSRLEHQENTAEKEYVQLSNLIIEEVELVEQQANQKNITITTEYDKEISCYTNRQRLSQVILNILSNAINYTDNGGKVIISFRENEKHVEISIKDNGVGIPEEDLERIFERFYRVDKMRSRNTGGTGLGLSIVKNLLHTMGGSISVTSQIEVGSEFVIYLAKTDIRISDIDGKTV